jgi:hypothetical protein
MPNIPVEVPELNGEQFISNGIENQHSRPPKNFELKDRGHPFEGSSQVGVCLLLF